MQELSVEFENFRAFSRTPSISIKPLTFLVGENSAGKTSFLAALNFILRFQEGDSSPRLNTDPFDLGSFDQIAHQGRGSFTTATDFSLSFTKNIDISRSAGVLPLILLPGGRRESSEPDYQICRIEIIFSSAFGSAEASSINFNLEDLSFSIKLTSKISLTAFLPERLELSTNAEMPFFEDIRYKRSLDLRFISYMLQSSIMIRRQDENRDKLVDKKIERIFLAFSGMMNSLPTQVYSSAPIRSIPERVYSASDVQDSPDGRSTPYRLRQLKVADLRRWQRLNKGLNDFGKLSGLFKRIDIGKLTKEAAGPFQLRLQVGSRRENIADVGYGVSQTLPLINELLEAPDRACFLFQQPEVHLHPRAQAGLGTFLSQYSSAHLDSLIVVETHSDYLIDRVRTEIRLGAIPAQAVNIVYLERTDASTNAYNISLDSNGTVIDPPACYRDFFLREQESILGIS